MADTAWLEDLVKVAVRERVATTRELTSTKQRLTSEARMYDDAVAVLRLEYEARVAALDHACVQLKARCDSLASELCVKEVIEVCHCVASGMLCRRERHRRCR
jgi:hypothetical protein